MTSQTKAQPMDCEMIEEKEAETFTERCRRMLDKQSEQAEFTLSRRALETLVLDSEQYALSNKVRNELLLTCRDIACDTTMMRDDSNAFISGSWDDSLPRIMRQIANHSLKTIEVQNRERKGAAS